MQGEYSRLIKTPSSMAVAKRIDVFNELHEYVDFISERRQYKAHEIGSSSLFKITS